MRFFKRFVKPSIVDENKVYVVDQIIRYIGKDRHYLLHNASEGMWTLLKKKEWEVRKNECVLGDITILFRDEKAFIELDCGTIEKLYAALDKARKENNL